MAERKTEGRLANMSAVTAPIERPPSTIWVAESTYVDGTCSGGYYDRQCSSGYWEYGLCYEGTFVPGTCIPGHYEYRFPGGTWSFEPLAAAPSECDAVRPSQLAIAATAAYVLKDKAYADLDSERQAALDRLIDSGRLSFPDEAAFDAVLQILDAVSTAPPAAP